eukprot:1067094-Alexandrium_andersonii.AAC.1
MRAQQGPGQSGTGLTTASGRPEAGLRSGLPVQCFKSVAPFALRASLRLSCAHSPTGHLRPCSGPCM